MVSRLIAEYSPVVPAHSASEDARKRAYAGNPYSRGGDYGSPFRGDDGFPVEESILSSPLHRAFLVIGILPIFDRGVLQRGLQISIRLLLHLHDVEVRALFNGERRTTFR